MYLLFYVVVYLFYYNEFVDGSTMVATNSNRNITQSWRLLRMPIVCIA